MNDHVDLDLLVCRSSEVILPLCGVGDTVVAAVVLSELGDRECLLIIVAGVALKEALVVLLESGDILVSEICLKLAGPLLYLCLLKIVVDDSRLKSRIVIFSVGFLDLVLEILGVLLCKREAGILCFKLLCGDL